MTEIEDRLRQALATEAERAQPGMLRPLHRPGATAASRVLVRLAAWMRVPAVMLGRARRAGRLLTPLAAAAAVIAVAAGVVIAGHAFTGARAGAAAPAADGPPPFYLTLSGKPGHLAAVVRDSRTGARLSSRAVPFAPGPGTWMWIAAGSDRTFALAVPEGGTGEHFFGLRVTPSGQAGKLTPLPVKPVGLNGSQVAGLALSPSGQQLAVTMTSPQASIEVASTRTGMTRTWTAHSNDIAFDPAWTDHGKRLGFGWARQVTGGRYPTSTAEVRLLDTEAPGHNLLASRVLVPDKTVPGAIQTALVTPDGGSVVASVTRNISGGGYDHGKIVAKIVRISATTGQVTATERTVTIPYHSSAGRYDAEDGCLLLAVDPTGHHILAQCRPLGSLAGTSFTPLPGSVAFPLVPSAAW
jgi:hypothetical protein